MRALSGPSEARVTVGDMVSSWSPGSIGDGGSEEAEAGWPSACGHRWHCDSQQAFP